jgi:hypothetical protein
MSDLKKDFSLKGLFAGIPPEFLGLFSDDCELRPWNALGEVLKKRIGILVLEQIEGAKNNTEFVQNQNNKIDTNGEVWIHKSAVIEP